MSIGLNHLEIAVDSVAVVVEVGIVEVVREVIVGTVVTIGFVAGDLVIVDSAFRWALCSASFVCKCPVIILSRRYKKVDVLCVLH